MCFPTYSTFSLLFSFLIFYIGLFQLYWFSLSLYTTDILCCLILLRSYWASWFLGFKCSVDSKNVLAMIILRTASPPLFISSPSENPRCVCQCFLSCPACPFTPSQCFSSPISLWNFLCATFQFLNSSSVLYWTFNFNDSVLIFIIIRFLSKSTAFFLMSCSRDTFQSLLFGL